MRALIAATVFVLPALATGCVDSSLVPCGDLVCPKGSVCLSDGCAAPDAVAACAGLPEGTPCTTPSITLGHCLNGVCRESVCGDRRIEFGETCDDGNTEGGDGCSARCDSNEMCGNGVPDYALGEECDLGPNLSNDGCTSACTVEIAQWTDVTPHGATVRTEHAMAYDSDRDRIVLFGGALGSVFLGDTWEWDGANWRQLSPPHSPSPRYGAAMVFDPALHRSVLFGGLATNGAQADTWVWDGIDWRQLSLPNSPPQRYRAAATWDSTRHNIVMFGGRDVGNMTSGDDTWVFDGAWTERHPATTPSPRANIAMAFDPVNQIAVMFGGTSLTPTLTFTWDGNDWTPHATPSGMTGIVGPMVAWNGTNVIEFGGSDGANAQGTTWSWTGTTWMPFTSVSGTSPPARLHGAMAYDGSEAVLFGGDTQSGNGQLDDQWTVDSQWTEVATATQPGGRGHAGVAYDALRGRTLVVAGGPDTAMRHDVWDWDGRAWTKRNNAPFTQRNEIGMTYDEANDDIVIFGGYTMTGNQVTAVDDTFIYSTANDSWQLRTLAVHPPGGYARLTYDALRHRVVAVIDNHPAMRMETWAWDGVAWTILDQSTLPPRHGFYIAYDRPRDRIVVFGGIGPISLLQDAELDETWLFDGTAWSQALPATVPPAREGAMLVYNEARARVLMFGGGAATARFDDSWEWDGTNWFRRTVPTAPDPRSEGMMAYDRARGNIVLFSGNFGQTIPDTTWAFAYQSFDVQRDACRGIDTDTDGLAGCDDPDCWGVCTPLCPPGTTCDSSAHHCGDGTCDPIEDYTICPSDCPIPVP